MKNECERYECEYEVGIGPEPVFFRGKKRGQRKM